MSTLTNKANLPEPLVTAILNKIADYNKGDCDFSATELLQPPRLRQLKKKHEQEIEEDVSDMIFSLIGSSIHTILEKSTNQGIPERRLFWTFEGGVRVSGQFDHLMFYSGELSDYKVTTVWKANDGPDPDFTAQLNILAALIDLNGLGPVQSVKNILLLRDWSKRATERDPSYPQKQVAIIHAPLWPMEQRVAFINSRIAIHKAAEQNLPFCTADETWRKENKYAVMKAKNTRATKIFNTKPEADEWIAKQKDASALRVEYRIGENIRCMSYCPVAGYCDQWKAWKKEHDVFDLKEFQ